MCSQEVPTWHTGPTGMSPVIGAQPSRLMQRKPLRVGGSHQEGRESVHTTRPEILWCSDPSHQLVVTCFFFLFLFVCLFCTMLVTWLEANEPLLITPEETEVQSFIIFLSEPTGPNWYFINLFTGMIILLQDEISYSYANLHNFRV